MRTALALVALLLTAGCDSDGVGGPLTDFGDPYSLAIGDDRPALYVSEGRISVPVQYGGGCAEHTFALRSDIDGDSATVWFHHDDGGDNCEAFLSEVINVPLPSAVDAAERITLRAPAAYTSSGATAIQLR